MPLPAHFTPLSHIFSVLDSPPLSLSPCSQESLPWGRGHFNVGSLAKAIRDPDSSTPYRHACKLTLKHTHTRSEESVIGLDDMACMFSISLCDITLSHQQALQAKLDKAKWGRREGARAAIITRLKTPQISFLSIRVWFSTTTYIIRLSTKTFFDACQLIRFIRGRILSDKLAEVELYSRRTASPVIRSVVIGWVGELVGKTHSGTNVFVLIPHQR